MERFVDRVLALVHGFACRKAFAALLRPAPSQRSQNMTLGLRRWPQAIRRLSRRKVPDLKRLPDRDTIMGKETFIAYWSGEEPTGPDCSPTLAQTPDTVDLVILFWASIDPNGDLNFSELVGQNDQATIMGWMAEIRQRQKGRPRRTRFLLSINSELLNRQEPDKFAKKVEDAARSWGVDGIDIDFEPPHSNPPVMPVIKAIKDALPAGSLLTAPIYRPWNDHANLKRQLASYATLFDYIMTMDYTPCVSYEDTIQLYEAYAQAMGGDAAAYGKLAIGVSCME